MELEQDFLCRLCCRKRRKSSLLLPVPDIMVAPVHVAGEHKGLIMFLHISLQIKYTHHLNYYTSQFRLLILITASIIYTIFLYRFSFIRSIFHVMCLSITQISIIIIGLKAENSCYYSVQTLFLLDFSLKIKYIKQ